MRLLRGLVGAVLWLVSALVGLVAVLLCVTLILLPVGLPLLSYARRLFTSGVKLMLPQGAAHPLKTAHKTVKYPGRRTRRGPLVAWRRRKSLRMRGRKAVRRARKHFPLAS